MNQRRKGGIDNKDALSGWMTNIVLSPLEFMQCLVALLPRPRLNLIRFHGVLATHAKLQAEIILGGQKTKSKPSNVNDDQPQLLASVHISWACL